MDEQESKKKWFSEVSGKGTILTAGIYRVELKQVRPGEGKGFDGSETRPTLMFSFREIAQGAVINRTVTANLGEQSGCVKLVRSMAGVNQPNSETVQDPNLFQDFIEKLIGQEFLAQVQPSGNGKYNNLINVFPAPPEQ